MRASKTFYLVIFSGLIFLFLTGCNSLSGLAQFSADNSALTPTQKIMLWNGHDFTGWQFVLKDKGYDFSKVWSITNSVILCQGKPFGYMRTDKIFTHYKLHVEWRWPKGGGNSGIYFHLQEPDEVWPIGKTFECQLYSGKAGQVLSRPTFHNSNEEPIGLWNSADILCRNNSVIVYINGVLQNQADDLGFTSGKIALQSEGTPIEFRNIYIEPLD